MAILYAIIVIAAIVGLIAGLTRVVVTAAIWFVIGLLIQAVFGPAIVSFFAAFGIIVPLGSIPAMTAVIGVIHGFLQ